MTFLLSRQHRTSTALNWVEKLGEVCTPVEKLDSPNVLPLSNAAKIYPLVGTARTSSLFQPWRVLTLVNLDSNDVLIQNFPNTGEHIL